MKELMAELFNYPRSLTGEGVRQTLRRIQREIPIEIREVPSGTKCFDWKVPQEWRFHSARLFDETGALLIDADNCGLHVLGYSEPFHDWVTFDELDQHVVVGPKECPDAIEYTTSYFERRWGLSVSWNQWQAVKRREGQRFLVQIKSELFPGSLTYADLVVPGSDEREVFLSTYCCHPQLAINELSGPVVMVELVKWWMSEPRRRTLRCFIAPETIGPLVYMASKASPGYLTDQYPSTPVDIRRLKKEWEVSRGLNFIGYQSWSRVTGSMLDHLKENVSAGFVLTCLGGRGHFSVQEGRRPNYASEIASYVLRPPSDMDSLFYSAPWEFRGSDERQWCAPGVDLPFCSIRKSTPGSDEYPEYHLSTDDVDACTEEQLQDSLDVMKRILTAIERDKCYRVTTLGEPQLGRRGLYATLSKRGSSASGKALLDVWSMCDTRSTLSIAQELRKPIEEVQDVLDILEREKLVEVVE